ncbi:cytidine deaminase-like protein [Sporodiniella umbellata]|nr:cytidine deaminase-like protein [Sporodiniella umbellata]
MFIGIIGPKSSGKRTIAEYLVNRYGFKILTLSRESGMREVSHDNMEFDSVENLQTFVTENWQDNFVICNLNDKGLETLRKRPFFLLLAVEAPVTMRYRRSFDRATALSKECVSLEDFLVEDDRNMYNMSVEDEHKTQPYKSLYNLMLSADLLITNAFRDIQSLYLVLEKLNIIDKERLRPSWDTYFMQLSDLAARRSNCMKRRVGCIIVKDSRVIATGYNGTPRGLRNCNEGGCGRCNEGAPCGTGLDRCLCMHAEENALLEAGRGSVNHEAGVILYTNTFPCLGCTIKIIQQGVKEVVYHQSYGMDEATAKIFREANVKLRQHSPSSLHRNIDY